MKKYELTDLRHPDPSFSHLRRIRALRDIRNPFAGRTVNKGDLGGFVESEANLSQENHCWIYDNAVSEKEAVVCEWAVLENSAYVTDRAVAKGMAVISGCAVVKDDAKAGGYAKVQECAILLDSSYAGGHAMIRGGAHLSHNASVIDHAIVEGTSIISQCATVSQEAQVRGHAQVSEYAILKGKTVVQQRGVVEGATILSGDSLITDSAHVALDYQETIQREELYSIKVDGSAVITSPSHILSVSSFDIRPERLTAFEDGEGTDLFVFFSQKESSLRLSDAYDMISNLQDAELREAYFTLLDIISLKFCPPEKIEQAVFEPYHEDEDEFINEKLPF